MVIGAPTSKERNSEVSKLFNYGFANYSTNVAMSEQDAEKLTVNISNGKTDSISCKINKPLAYFGKRTATKDVEVKFIPESVSAPVKEGDRVGRAEAYADGKLVASVDVFAAESVEKSRHYRRYQGHCRALVIARFTTNIFLQSKEAL